MFIIHMVLSAGGSVALYLGLCWRLSQFQRFGWITRKRLSQYSPHARKTSVTLDINNGLWSVRGLALWGLWVPAREIWRNNSREFWLPKTHLLPTDLTECVHHEDRDSVAGVETPSEGFTTTTSTLSPDTLLALLVKHLRNQRHIAHWICERWNSSAAVHCHTIQYCQIIQYLHCVQCGVFKLAGFHAFLAGMNERKQQLHVALCSCTQLISAEPGLSGIPAPCARPEAAAKPQSFSEKQTNQAHGKNCRKHNNYFWLSPDRH